MSSSRETPIIRPGLLDILLRAPGAVTVDDLAQRIEMTTDQALRELGRLESAGCELQRHPQHGVRLIESGLGTWVDYLQWGYPIPPREGGRGAVRSSAGASTPRSGDPGPRIVEVYAQTTSTQDIAKRYIRFKGAGCDHAVFIADHQTAGRGRLGRQWFVPPGCGATFSMVSVDDRTPRHQRINLLTFLSAVGIARALEPLVHPRDIRIKWPNDLLVDGRKIAGVLVETVPVPSSRPALAAIIGIGINVSLSREHLGDAPSGLRDSITSLSMLGRGGDRLRVIGEVLCHMDRVMQTPDPTPLVDEWRDRCPTQPGLRRFLCDGKPVEGEIVDIDPFEGLIIRTPCGTLLHLPAASTSPCALGQ